MAVASQKITLTRFFERILGAFTAAPTRLDPVSQIPHAAPTTENPKPIAIPQLAHENGDKWENISFQPEKCMYVIRKKRDESRNKTSSSYHYYNSTSYNQYLSFFVMLGV